MVPEVNIGLVGGHTEVCVEGYINSTQEHIPGHSRDMSRIQEGTYIYCNYLLLNSKTVTSWEDYSVESYVETSDHPFTLKAYCS